MPGGLLKNMCMICTFFSYVIAENKLFKALPLKFCPCHDCKELLLKIMQPRHWKYRHGRLMPCASLPACMFRVTFNSSIDSWAAWLPGCPIIHRRFCVRNRPKRWGNTFKSHTTAPCQTKCQIPFGRLETGKSISHAPMSFKICRLLAGYRPIWQLQNKFASSLLPV